MNIGSSLERAINEQISEEIASSQMYRQAYGWLKYHGYEGFAKLYEKYYKEELKHADMFTNHLLDRNGVLMCEAIKQHTEDFDSIQEIVDATLEHEIYITSKITELYELCIGRGLISQKFMLDMLNEQIEEEDKAQTLVDRVSIAGKDDCGLLILDTQLGD